MANWQVNAARSHFSDVLDQADTQGPQIITHHGKERSVVLSIDEYRSLREMPEPTTMKAKLDFISFLLSGPKFDDFEIERESDTGREVDFGE